MARSVKTGCIDELVEDVEGKVWEVATRQDMLHKVNSEKAVIHIKQAGKEVHIRFCWGSVSGYGLYACNAHTGRLLYVYYEKRIDGPVLYMAL